MPCQRPVTLVAALLLPSDNDCQPKIVGSKMMDRGSAAVHYGIVRSRGTGAPPSRWRPLGFEASLVLVEAGAFSIVASSTQRHRHLRPLSANRQAPLASQFLDNGNDRRKGCMHYLFRLSVRVGALYRLHQAASCRDRGRATSSVDTLSLK